MVLTQSFLKAEQTKFVMRRKSFVVVISHEFRNVGSRWRLSSQILVRYYIPLVLSNHIQIQYTDIHNFTAQVN